MKKKDYQKATMRVVKCETERHLLAGSDQGGSSINASRTGYGAAQSW